jgi:hypothetical protein
MEHIVKLPKQGINSEVFRKETGWDLVVRDGVITVVGDCNEDEALLAIKNHNPKVAELSIEQKLAYVGLSIDDLKVALGI